MRDPNPNRRISLMPPPRSNPISPEISLLIPEESNISTREECVELTAQFSDITLVVGPPHNQRNFYLHRLIIAHQSPILFELCVGTSPPPTASIFATTPPLSAALIRTLPRIEPEVFDHIVKWLYKAKLTDREADIGILRRVYEASEYLKIHELSMKVLDNLRLILDRERKEREGKNPLETPMKDCKCQKKTSEPGMQSMDAVVGATATSSGEGEGSNESKTKKLVKDIMGKISPRKGEKGPDENGNDNSFLGTLRRRGTAKNGSKTGTPITGSPITKASASGTPSKATSNPTVMG
ncbi:hypothetical protein ABW19_dt0202040 [Dactylella cylindrospora]|nr:hypothetical protein ABW19_dt0202040 [Dactylella cylindrospora]